MPQSTRSRKVLVDDVSVLVDQRDSSESSPTTNSPSLFHGFEAALRASKCVNWMTLAQSSTLLRIYVIAITMQIVSSKFLVRISCAIPRIAFESFWNNARNYHPDPIVKRFIESKTDVKRRGVNTIVALSMILSVFKTTSRSYHRVPSRQINRSISVTQRFVFLVRFLLQTS